MHDVRWIYSEPASEPLGRAPRGLTLLGVAYAGWFAIDRGLWALAATLSPDWREAVATPDVAAIVTRIGVALTLLVVVAAAIAARLISRALTRRLP